MLHDSSSKVIRTTYIHATVITILNDVNVMHCSILPQTTLGLGYPAPHVVLG